MMPDLSGTRAGPGGRYRLLYEIGRGGMGVVYRAEDEHLGRALAVKALLGDPASNPDLVRRFGQEARITGQLQHPGIPPVHDWGAFPDGRPYYVMKLIEGRTLADLLASRSSPRDGQPRLLAVFEALCNVLAYAHSRGVVHNDLKPGNVMAGEFGEIQVMDWGLARWEGWAEPDNSSSEYPPPPDGSASIVSGTLGYIAPERAQGGVGDKSSDVFSLGAILCEILTGAPPYAGEPLVRVLAGDTGEAVRRLRWCGAPRSLTDLATRCLSRDPLGRPASAGELAAQLRRCLDGSQSQPLLEGGQDRERTVWRRVNAVAALGTLVFTGIASLVAYAWYHDGTLRANEMSRQAEAYRRAVGATLIRASELAERRQWAAALAALEPARELPSGLHGQLAQVEASLRLALDLDQAHLEGLLGPPESRFGPVQKAFAWHGAALDGNPADIAARLRSGPGLSEALSILHAMLAAEADDEQRRRLQAILSIADPDSWYSRLRAARGKAEAGALVEEAPPGPPLPGALLLLASRLGAAEGLRLRRELQARYPEEMWYALDLSIDLARRPGSLAEAALLAKAALAARPTAAAWAHLGSLQRRLRRPAEARRSYQRAVDLAPESVPVREGLMLALAEEGRPTEASAQAAWVLARDPFNPRAHLTEGAVQLRAGSLRPASRHLLAAIEANPGDGLAWAYLAYLRYLQEDCAAAELAARRAITLASWEALPWAVLGLARAEAGAAAEAEAAFLHAEERGGVEGAILTARLPERPEPALLLLTAALRCDPGYREAEPRIAARISRAPKLASTLLEGVAIQQPRRPTLWKLLAQARAAAGRPGAVAAWRRAAELDPQDPEPIFQAGLALWRARDLDGARSAVFQAWGLSPRDPEVTSALVALLTEMGEAAQAARLTEKARRAGLELADFAP